MMPGWLQRLIAWFKWLFGGQIGASPAQPGIQPPVPSAAALTPLVPLAAPATAAPKPLGQPQLALETGEPPEYRKNHSLMTYQERYFYNIVLVKGIGAQYQIFSKVRLGDLIWIANEPADRFLHNSRIQCKHIDFVLCDKKRLEPVLAIELDDSSHVKYDRRESDELKDFVCAEAGLPLLRVKVQQAYPISEIIAEIRNKIEAQQKQDQAQDDKPSDS